MMNNKRKIDLTIVYLGKGIGGIQIRILDILEYANRMGLATQLILNKREGVFVNRVPRGVQIITCHFGGRFWPLPAVCLYKLLINDLVTKPKIILAFADHSASLVLLARKIVFWKSSPIYVAEDIFLSKYLKFQPCRTIRKLLVRWLYPSATRIFVLSTAHRDDLMENFSISLKKIIILRNWVSPHFKVIRRAGEKDIDVLFVGRLELQKNLTVFIDVIGELKKIYPNIQAYVVGPGSQREYLEKYVNNRRLGGNITFTGYKANPSSYYNRAKIFLLTSLFEGQPLALLEAMRCGVPIVAFHYNGVKSVIRQGANGLIVKTIKAATAAILQLFVSKKDWRRMSKNCKSISVREHSTKQLTQLINQLH